MPSTDKDLIARVEHLDLKRKHAHAENLPPKVLEDIFEILRDDHCVTTTRDHGFLSSWIRATWVCRSWRAVALATPRLWYWIDITGRHYDPEAITTLLARSGSDNNLSISIDGQAIDMAQACHLVQPAAHRVRHLSVCMDNDQAPLIDELLWKMGESLETLQLYGSVNVKEYHINLDAARVTNIHTLTLTRAFIYPTDKLHQLKELTLIHVCSESQGVYGKEYVYSMLTMCPNLEILDLEDAFPDSTLVDARTFPESTLSKLHTLRVNELAVDLPTNLENIVAPSLTTLQIVARYDGLLPYMFETPTVTGEEEEDGEDGIVLPMHTLPVSKFRSFPLLMNQERICLHLGSPDTFGDICVYGDNWEVVVPTLEDEVRGPNRLPELLDHIFTEFPTAFVDPANIKYLELHIALGVPECGSWAEMLVQFPKVEKLTVGGRNAFSDFMVALNMNPKVLPLLHELTVCLAAPDTALTAAVARAFGAMLAQRAGVGFPMTSVTVRVPEIEPNDATFILASALVAYSALRGVKVDVERQDCLTCHTDEMSEQY